MIYNTFKPEHFINELTPALCYSIEIVSYVKRSNRIGSRLKKVFY